MHTPLINEYTLRFTPDISSSLVPVDQIIRIILEKRVISLPLLYPLASAHSPPQQLCYSIRSRCKLWIPGNFIGSSDRYANTDTSTVIRKIKLSSSTLQLTGTTTLYTAEMESLLQSSVSCLTPKNGTRS